MACSISRSIWRRTAGSNDCDGVDAQAAKSAATTMLLRMRRLTFGDQGTHGEGHQRSDHGVPRPGDGGGETDQEDDGEACAHADQRGLRASALRAAEQEDAEDRAV